MVDPFSRRGWIRFPYDPNVMRWVSHVMPTAREAVADPTLRRNWMRAGDTWFVGVNALPNNEKGRIVGGPPLAGAVMDFIRAQPGMGDLALDRAQLSVIWPGYPRQDGTESDTAFQFRRDRDAAHLDGLKRHAEHGYRHIGECHAYILGVPLTPTATGASPLVLWEGSHEVMRRALISAVQGMPTDQIGQVDVTNAYVAARRQAFAACRRVEIHAQPGEAYLLHRLTLHGVAPWTAGQATPEGRVIAYFRPEIAGSVAEWLSQP